MNKLIDYHMDPNHLDNAELDYELIIRDAEVVGTNRTKAIAVKKLIDEDRPVVKITYDEESFTRCLDKLGDLQKKLKLEMQSNAEAEMVVTKSKVKHHIDKAYRLAGEDNEKTQIINGMIQSFVRMARLSEGSPSSSGKGSYRDSGKLSPAGKTTLELAVGRGRGRKSVSRETLPVGSSYSLEATQDRSASTSGFTKQPNNVVLEYNISARRETLEPELPRPVVQTVEYTEPQNMGTISNHSKTNIMDTWKVSFSGDDKISLTDFLWRVEMYSQADRVSKQQLHRGMFRLLKDNALEWFEVSYGKYATWDELVRGMKARFLPSNYDFLMLEEILCRIQQPNESVAMFFTHMYKLFQRIYPSLDEQYKLYILQRNMLVQFSRQLSVVKINSVEELEEICKRFDEARLLEEKRCNTVQKSKPLEPQASHQWQSSSKGQSRPKVATITEDMGNLECNEVSGKMNNQRNNRHFNRRRFTGRKCWNCGECGHGHFDCKQARTRIFCWVCGADGVKADECKKNHAGIKGEEKLDDTNPRKTTSSVEKPGNC